MTGAGGILDAAADLDRFAAEVLALPGVSRLNPHAFVEEKSELAGRMRDRADALRGGTRPTSRRPAPSPRAKRREQAVHQGA